MRAAAGHACEAVNAPESALGRFIAERRDNGMVVFNETHRLLLDSRQERGQAGVACEVDSRFFRRNMRTNALNAGSVLVDKLQHHFRRKVKPHQAVTSVPIDAYFYVVARLQGMAERQCVDNTQAVFPCLQHGIAAECPAVAFLPPGKGEEDRLVELHVLAIDLNNRGGKRGEIRVLPEDFLRHGFK